MPVHPVYSNPIMLEHIKFVSGKNSAAESRENILSRENKSRGEKINDSTKNSMVTQNLNDNFSFAVYSLRLQQGSPTSKLKNSTKIFNDKKQLLSVYLNPSIYEEVIPSAPKESGRSNTIGNGYYISGPNVENISHPKLLTATTDSAHENIRKVYSLKNRKYQGTLVNLLC